MKRKMYTNKRILSGFLYGLLMFLLAFSVAQLRVKREDDLAHLLGVGMVTVNNDDMTSDLKGHFSSKDLLFVKMLSYEDKHELVMGDIVVVYDLQSRRFIAHRIEEIITDDGQLYYLIKGDLNDTMDQPVATSDIIGIKRGHISGIASIYDYIQSPKGFALFILLPVVLLWILSAIILVRSLLIYHRKNLEKSFLMRAEAQALEVEHEFMHIRQQLLKEFHLDN